MTTTTVYDLYRAPLNVWVEDPLTSSVLTALWGDAQINVIVSEGKAGVLHMVGSAPARLRGKVYGVVDRDLEPDNKESWKSQKGDVLRLPAHEFENILLDFEVLASLSKGSSPDAIRAHARAYAGTLHCWMVCKAALREMQQDLGSGFPAEPRVPPALGAPRNLSEVAAYLQQHEYWSKHAAILADWRGPQFLREKLRKWSEQYEADLASGSWVTSFSGKEIFRDLRSHIPGLDEAPKRPPQPTPAERDENLGKRVARKMRELNRVPSALTELRQVLRTKAGL